MDHEKYISIEYNIWETKYKPIEEILERVERELAEERRNKKIKIYLDYRHFRYDKTKEIGYIDLHAGNIPSSLSYADVQAIMEAIIEASDYRTKAFLTKEDVQQQLIKFEEKEQKLLKLEFENYEKYKNIPKFVKWLFKIKV